MPRRKKMTPEEREIGLRELGETTRRVLYACVDDSVAEPGDQLFFEMLMYKFRKHLTRDDRGKAALAVIFFDQDFPAKTPPAPKRRRSSSSEGKNGA